MVIVINIISQTRSNGNGASLDPEALSAFLPLKLSLLAANVGKVSAIWSITVALIISSIAAAFIGRKRFIVMDGFLAPINYAAISSATAVLNVASGYAFGCVITSLPGFVLSRRRSSASRTRSARCSRPSSRRTSWLASRAPLRAA